ncbi:TPA: hypothetical protein U2M19_003981 [Providencia rettgeri]|uniref:hypothetical protein n=1 Tax=Providencia rettgeri TaxID=587 RepID=UPI0018C834F7|nr:hypothetical protein [Providencia rettgeri]MBG5925420.1 hypothetical protein [Providencia rettgeri]HEM7189353.1 hypothetical protein [Providencia rettgeri]HEM8213074.1 hypothetical protein [Providencia rettgeri]
MRFIVPFFLVLSSYAHSDSYIVSNNGFGLLPLSFNASWANWAVEGSISTNSSLYTIGSTYNANSYGCTGPNNWCSTTVYSREIYFSGGAVALSTKYPNSTPLGTTGGGVCYFTALGGVMGPNPYNQLSGQAGSSLLQNNTASGNTKWALSSSWTKIDKSCNELTNSSKEVANMILPVPAFSGHVLMAPCRGSSASCDGAFNVRYGSIYTQQYASEMRAVFRPSAKIVACGAPVYSSSCSAGNPQQGDTYSTPNIPTTSCDVVVPSNLNIDEVTNKEYIGKQVEDQIVITCNSGANLKISLSNDGLVTVGPFNVSVTVDGSKSASVNVSNNSKSIPIKAKISSSNSSMAIEPGTYTGNVVVVTSIQ